MSAERPPRQRRPIWLRPARPQPGPFRSTAALLDELRVSSVCREARCPNRAECYAHGTATFLVLGNACTRRCRFCAVGWSAAPEELDQSEPRRIADAVVRLGLRHAVITSVTRDDLEDGGAHHMAAVISAVHGAAPSTSVEALVSDMNGDEAALRVILAAGPDVLAHNLETVRRLSPSTRPEASYDRSLALLRRAASLRPWGANTPGQALARAQAWPVVKSGLMVGLGEHGGEVQEMLSDCAAAGVDVVTIGQYLQPRPECVPVCRYVTPAEFAALEEQGRALGLAVYAGPLVRSSYRAAEQLSTSAARIQSPAGRAPQTRI